MTGTLHRDANIWLRDGPAIVFERDARRQFGRVNAQDVSGGAVQPDEAKIAGLKDASLVIEEEPDVVGGVVLPGIDLFMGKEADLRVSVSKKGDETLGHGTAQTAPVLLLEFDGVGEPSNRVPQSAHRELHQHVLASSRIVVPKYRLCRALRKPNLDPTSQVVALGTVDASCANVRLIQSVPTIEIAQPETPVSFE